MTSQLEPRISYFNRCIMLRHTFLMTLRCGNLPYMKRSSCFVHVMNFNGIFSRFFCILQIAMVSRLGQGLQSSNIKLKLRNRTFKTDFIVI